jgi:hypothetical protein
MKRILVCAAGVLLFAGVSMAGEKGLMHCFAYTTVDTASESDWDAFYKATDALPQKIKGLKRVWYGKLTRPLQQVQLNVPDPGERKKLTEAGKGTAEVRVVRRQAGVCMEFADEAAYKAYGADPAHKEWEAVYGKVRVPGTTTYQILGQ